MAPRRLTVRARTDALAGVRRAVAAWAAAAGLGERATQRLVTAVDEALANAIEHGLHADARRRVEVTAHPAPDGLTVAVSYRGARFDPLTAPLPSPAEALRARAAHGYGVHLLRRLADDVAFVYQPDRGGGRNEVRLTVRGAPPRA